MRVSGPRNSRKASSPFLLCLLVAKWRPWGRDPSTQQRLFPGLHSRTCRVQLRQEVPVEPVFLHHRPGLQAPETAAPTCLLCAECSPLTAGRSLLGWNCRCVQCLSPAFGLDELLFPEPHACEFCASVRESGGQHRGVKLPAAPGVVPEVVGAKVRYEECLVQTTLRSPDSLVWLGVMSSVERCLRLSSEQSEKWPGNELSHSVSRALLPRQLLAKFAPKLFHYYLLKFLSQGGKC